MNVWSRIANALARRRIDAKRRGIIIDGRLWLHGSGRVAVGETTRFEGGAAGIELLALQGSDLVIGARCVVGEGVSIEATRSIIIGNDVHIGPFAKVIDSNFHTLDGDRHQRPKATPVVIEDGVELGERVIVLPGATIGAGARVQARSVVRGRVPPGVEVMGNPAKPVRR